MRRIKLSKTLKCETSNSQWRPRRRRQRHRWWPAPCHTELVHGRINNSDPIRILCLKQFRSLSHLHSYAQKTIFDTFWYASTPRYVADDGIHSLHLKKSRDCCQMQSFFCLCMASPLTLPSSFISRVAAIKKHCWHILRPVHTTATSSGGDIGVGCRKMFSWQELGPPTLPPIHLNHLQNPPKIYLAFDTQLFSFGIAASLSLGRASIYQPFLHTPPSLTLWSWSS